MAEAGSITYFTLLAVFPALAALVSIYSIYGLFADPGAISGQLEAASGVVPGGGMDIVREQVNTLASNSNKALGFGVVVGLLASLWSANQGTKSTFDVLNIIYGEQEKRAFLVRTAESLAVTLGALLFDSGDRRIARCSPVCRAGRRVRHADPGLALAGAAVRHHVAARGDLSIWPEPREGEVALGDLGQRVRRDLVDCGNRGVLVVCCQFRELQQDVWLIGAAIGFMTWIWISAIVALIGAELDSEMERQTERESTAGPERPRGTRGATRADDMADA